MTRPAIDLDSVEGPLRRRDLLQVLLNSRDYRSSDVVLRTVVREMGRYAYSGEACRADLHMLANLGLLKTEAVGDLLMAELLERGRDVALGDSACPEGIALPEPRRA